MEPATTSDSKGLLRSPRRRVYDWCFEPDNLSKLIVTTLIVTVAVGLFFHYFFASKPKYFNERYGDTVFPEYKKRIAKKIEDDQGYRGGVDAIAAAKHRRYQEVAKQSFDDKLNIYKERVSDINLMAHHGIVWVNSTVSAAGRSGS